MRKWVSEWVSESVSYFLGYRAAASQLKISWLARALYPFEIPGSEYIIPFMGFIVLENKSKNQKFLSPWYQNTIPLTNIQIILKDIEYQPSSARGPRSSHVTPAITHHLIHPKWSMVGHLEIGQTVCYWTLHNFFYLIILSFYENLTHPKRLPGGSKTGRQGRGCWAFPSTCTY